MFVSSWFGLKKKRNDCYVVTKFTDGYCLSLTTSVGPAQYHYNIDAIVQTIAAAHEARLATTNQVNADNLKRIEEQYYKDLESVKQTYETRLQELITERSNTVQETADTAEATYNAAKAEGSAKVTALDEEAIKVIEAVWAQQEAGNDLTNFIPTLGKEWFSIDWSDSNRRALDYAPKQPAYNGYQDPYAGYPNYQQPAQQGYVENYGAIAGPSAPAAPATAQYDAAHTGYYASPATPEAPAAYYGNYGEYNGASQDFSIGTPSAPDAGSYGGDYGYGYQQPADYGYAAQNQYYY